MTIEYPLLSECGYQLLPLTASQSVSDNREFDVLGILSAYLLIVGGEDLMTIEHP